MPDTVRTPLRFDCNGLDLVHPLDRMPVGSYGYLFNVRVLQEGRVDGRPGYTRLLGMSDPPNSIRRLNDPDMSYAPTGYIYVAGGGDNLYAGAGTDFLKRDTGYSGDPLSLIPFRPDQAPESWMYVYDRNKLSKVRPDGAIRDIGVVPPSTAPSIEYGVPAWTTLQDGQSSVGWNPIGAATAVATTNRESAVTVDTIVGVMPGWVCISPTGASGWMGERMQVILNVGQPNAETVVVREIHPAIQATTIAAITYDDGTTGLCTLVLDACPPGLTRNSILVISGTESARVLEVNKSPDGATYSVRVSLAANYAVGAAVTGKLSWFVFLTQAHAVAETITSDYVAVSQAAQGTGSVNITAAVNAGRAGFRVVDPANDYMHVSLYLQNPESVSQVMFMLCLDAAPVFNFDQPGNCYLFTLSGTELQLAGSSNSSWVEVVVPISSAARFGTDLTRGLSNISGLAIQVIGTAGTNWGFDWWYLFGTHGPAVQANSPIGLQYQTRFRDSSTGAKSVPSPVTRYELFPLREAVIITSQTTPQVGVDSVDVYRLGGAVTSPMYVLSLPNDNFNPHSIVDSIPDALIVAADQPPDLTALQPWPLLVTPWSGTVKVVGTSISWVSGTKFNLALLSSSVVLINGNAFLTYGQPLSDEHLEVTEDAGNFLEASYEIASPTLAGQPLPFAFGALEGPFAPVVFALGDPVNGGQLYFTNFSDADSAADSNTLELAPPSNNLISGAVWNGLAIAGNREKLFGVRFAFLTTLASAPATPFQWTEIPVLSGMWSRWACCATSVGVAYLGRDGVYIATDAGSVNITDQHLYPMFPHDGEPAKTINSGSNIILPVDMTQLDFLNMTSCGEEIRFSYVDTGGNFNTLIYEIPRKRWFLNNYAHQIRRHYLVESDAEGPNTQDLLMLSVDDETIKIAGGNTDDGFVINSLLLSPSADGGDDRSQKLYVDTMVMADGIGNVSMAAAFDNAQAFSPVFGFTCDGAVRQFIQPIASQSDLTLYRNIGVKLAWSGGPDGPRVYSWESTGYLQPYLSKNFVTQFSQFSFPGWKSMRRLYASLISTTPVYFTIKTQDGRTYGPYTIPSTFGQYRTLVQMLDQGIKDLAFSLQIDGRGNTFALFPQDFTIEVKDWIEATYILLACFRA